ncbi:hypothetical protein [Lignipirellula cremea]|uniref:hypothetical protein n=1 Tax=Lignipirellula cremea TaxID=2528010 RepID=UPI0011A6A5F8|nr:hypothetical protein [Lignipirellula cremea]
MNESIEFHDSTVSCVRAVGGDLVVRFSKAYVHRSTGDPGVSPGVGVIRSAELVFFEASSFGDLARAHGEISDGYIAFEGQRFSLLALPFASSAAVTAELVFQSGASLTVSAASARCEASGAARFVDSFPG